MNNMLKDAKTTNSWDLAQYQHALNLELLEMGPFETGAKLFTMPMYKQRFVYDGRPGWWCFTDNTENFHSGRSSYQYYLSVDWQYGLDNKWSTIYSSPVHTNTYLNELRDKDKFFLFISKKPHSVIMNVPETIPSYVVDCMLARNSFMVQSVQKEQDHYKVMLRSGFTFGDGTTIITCKQEQQFENPFTDVLATAAWESIWRCIASEKKASADKCKNMSIDIFAKDYNDLAPAELAYVRKIAKQKVLQTSDEFTNAFLDCRTKALSGPYNNIPITEFCQEWYVIRRAVQEGLINDEDQQKIREHLKSCENLIFVMKTSSNSDPLLREFTTLEAIYFDTHTGFTKRERESPRS